MTVWRLVVEVSGEAVEFDTGRGLDADGGDGGGGGAGSDSSTSRVYTD